MSPRSALRNTALALSLMCAAPRATARIVAVQDMQGLAAAMRNALPGDAITLADGVYPISQKLRGFRNGKEMAPITVRSDHKQGAHIRSTAQIAFEITGAHWQFADLDISGVCALDTDCEHAFHVVGASNGFVLRGNRIADFNAQIKVNADGAHVLPENGLIEHNEFFDSHPRRTNNPVAPINIDNAVGWVVRANFIHDFQKDGSGEGSYGAFVKGGAKKPIIERNLVYCARDRGPMGSMVGLSFGAHGMDADLCPPYWDAAKACDPEVSGGIMRNNIVSGCDDDGIYLFRATGSAILFNTLVRTAGIEFRSASSTGLARGNLMSGTIGAAQGGSFSNGGNVTGLAPAGDLPAWLKYGSGQSSLAGPDLQIADDYCGHPRGKAMDVGAVQVSTGTCALWHWSSTSFHQPLGVGAKTDPGAKIDARRLIHRY
jgi:hypothetical protein